MTQKEILKGNKLIAEFMGYGSFRYETPHEDAGYINGEPTCFCYDSGLKFHSSWNWLMPVVEKIENDSDTTINVENDNCHLEGDVNHSVFCLTKIESVWQACVEFIEWYNEQNKS